MGTECRDCENFVERDSRFLPSVVICKFLSIGQEGRAYGPQYEYNQAERCLGFKKRKLKP